MSVSGVALSLCHCDSGRRSGVPLTLSVLEPLAEAPRRFLMRPPCEVLLLEPSYTFSPIHITTCYLYANSLANCPAVSLV